jgi:broad specificity phosphatase PhoE
MNNTLLLLRHGHSEANELEKIISDPLQGCNGYGLSATGRRTLLARLPQLFEGMQIDKIISSDFLRTRQTADIVAGLAGQVVQHDIRLRERFFGSLDGSNADNYAEIWRRDAANSSHNCWGVESTEVVAARMLSVVEEINRSFDNCCVILVSHGDPLQILEASLQGLDPGQHRNLEPLSPGELRALS